MHDATDEPTPRNIRWRLHGALIAATAVVVAAGLTLTSPSAGNDARALDAAQPAGAHSTVPDAQPAEGRELPAPDVDESSTGAETEMAVLAGGCFWGVQGVFQHVDGVISAVSGYAGGEQDTAHYETVGTGTTNHAESVAITFDPGQLSYGRILQIYFSVAHDPTQLDRQGPDIGPQYRSTIFPTDAEQASIAAAYIDQLDQARVFDAAIVTTIEPDRAFYPAEDYHQDFMTLNPTHPYIVANDLPKIEALQYFFPDLYRPDPVLVQAGTSATEPAPGSFDQR